MRSLVQVPEVDTRPFHRQSWTIEATFSRSQKALSEVAQSRLNAHIYPQSIAPLQRTPQPARFPSSPPIPFPSVPNPLTCAADFRSIGILRRRRGSQNFCSGRTSGAGSRRSAVRFFVRHPSPSTTTDRRRLPAAAHLNFYRLHLLVFTFLPLVASGIFYASNGPSQANQIAYVDALFLCTSAMTLTGLNTALFADLTVWQQFILFVRRAI